MTSARDAIIARITQPKAGRYWVIPEMATVRPMVTPTSKKMSALATVDAYSQKWTIYPATEGEILAFPHPPITMPAATVAMTPLKWRVSSASTNEK